MKTRTGFYAYTAVSCCFGIAVSATGFHWGLLFLFSLYSLWIYRQDDKPRMLFSAVLFSSIIFYCYVTLSDQYNTTKHAEDEYRFLGNIHTPVNIDGNKVSFEMTSQKKEMFLVEYFLADQREKIAFEELNNSTECLFQGVLKQPAPATNPHAFDYQTYLKRQQIHWILMLSAPPLKCYTSEKFSLTTKLQTYRENGIHSINKNIEQPVSGFMISLIFGDRSYLNTETLETYQLLGLIHLLAISGLHVGVITAAVFYLGIRIGRTRQFMNLFLILSLPVYVILAGGAPSVMRAGTMTAVVLLYLFWEKKLLSIDSIGIACILVLLIDPYFLFHIGFQLSFAVSLALLLSAEKISLIKGKIVQIFYVSFIAQIASLPLLLWYFYEFSLWSPLLNVIFIPFFSLFVLPLSFVLFFIMLWLPELLPVIVPVMTYPLKIINSAAVWFAELPAGTLVFGKPSIRMMGMYVFVIVLFFYLLEKNRYMAAYISLIMCLLFHWNISYLNPFGKVVVLDIGQGDAIFIRLPFNKGEYLLDTGGTFSFPQEEWKTRKKEFNSGDQVLVPFLKAEGVRKLDKLILSHGDYDHIGNVSSLWTNVKIKEMFVPIGFGSGELETEILRESDERGVHKETVRPGTGWDIDGFSFLFLHPDKVYEEKNDGSVVVYAKLGGSTWLFTGDLEEKGERNLMNRYPDLEVDVLKAGHHGSRTSSNAFFVELLKPEVALISAGRNNQFGHPHPEVLEQFDEAGVIIYRTDMHGAIIFQFTHQVGTFSTVLP
jgi:competence protein ComEC